MGLATSVILDPITHIFFHVFKNFHVCIHQNNIFFSLVRYLIKYHQYISVNCISFNLNIHYCNIYNPIIRNPINYTIYSNCLLLRLRHLYSLITNPRC